MAQIFISDDAKKQILNCTIISVKPPDDIIKASSACLSGISQVGRPLTLPALPYDYNALEPAISKTIMELHHSKHHNAYVTNFNAALDQLETAVHKKDVNAILALQPAIKFNGGGHLNHALFWENLAPPSATGKIGPKLQAAIDASFGGFDEMKKELSTKSVGVQGSGWGWLTYNPGTGRLEVATSANQDPIQATTGLVPLLGIDVWEHAYYLDRQNRRNEYVDAIWSVINWNTVEDRLAKAQK